MKKAVTTRIKVTKSGKLIMRKRAQCHFRAKKTGKQLLRKAKTNMVHGSVFRKLSKKQGEF